MEDNTTKYNQAILNIKKCIDQFHTENPDLFINDINIVVSEGMCKRKIMAGLKLTILVQPSREGNR